MKPVTSDGRVFNVYGTPSLERWATKCSGKKCRSLILMATETRDEKIELGGCIITQCFLLLSFFAFFFHWAGIQQAFSLLSRVTPICYLMASSLLVRFPICGQTVPLPHSAEQENNIRSLARVLGARSCSRATKNELLLSQVWAFALKPAFDETLLWISTLLFAAGQSARSLWRCPFFFLFFTLVSFWSTWWSHIFLLRLLHPSCFQSQITQATIPNLQLLS